MLSLITLPVTMPRTNMMKGKEIGVHVSDGNEQFKAHTCLKTVNCATALHSRSCCPTVES